MMDRKDSENHAIEEIHHSLEEWGIKKLSSNPDHVKFRRKAIQQVIFCINSGSNSKAVRDSQKTPTRKFPTESVSAAYEHVLRVSAVCLSLASQRH